MMQVGVGGRGVVPLAVQPSAAAAFRRRRRRRRTRPSWEEGRGRAGASIGGPPSCVTAEREI